MAPAAEEAVDADAFAIAAVEGDFDLLPVGGAATAGVLNSVPWTLSRAPMPLVALRSCVLIQAERL